MEKKGRLVFGVYMEKTREGEKVEVASNVEKENVPALLQAMRLWVTHAKGVKGLDVRDLEEREMLPHEVEFKRLQEVLRALSDDEAEQLSKDVASVLKGVRGGR